MRRRVLIVCRGNIARSQMVAGWWRHYGGAEWDVRSAGTRPGREVHPVAVRVMAERGVDISARRPEPVESHAQSAFDVVVTVCAVAEAECPEFPSAQHERWPMDDPAIAGDDAERELAVFRRLRDEAEARVLAFLGRSEHSRRSV